jgi:hypothetical protein
MNPLFRLGLAGAALLALAACGGGSSSISSQPKYATTGLKYTNPAEGQGSFALIEDAASTPSALVLDLVGPGGSTPTPACGVTFGFDVDTTMATWVTSPVVSNGAVFTATNQEVQGWVNSGRLQAIVANKGLSTQVADLGTQVIAKITLQPVLGGFSGAVSLKDNGLGNLVDKTGTFYTFPVQVGTLTLY